MAVYRTVTVTATIATNTVTANGEVSEHIFTADADGQQVIVTDPYVAVETVEEGVLLTVRDAHEETQAVIYNGQKGDKGNPGVDGFSPTATVTKSGTVVTITITDKNGTTTATVSDGIGNDVYWCSYGATTSAQIETALTNGKIPMVKYQDYVYTLRFRNSATLHRFICNYGDIEKTIICQSGFWAPAADRTFLTTSNLVTSVSSSSTDTQYPSAKCVYDLVGNIETLLASI